MISLRFRDGGVYAPVVRKDRIHLSPVKIDNDERREVEVASGLSPGDLLTVNVGERVEEGDPVQPVMADAIAK
jgi:HlyD family secretion protein